MVWLKEECGSPFLPVASFWYTAWVNAGQPDLKNLSNQQFSEADIKEFDKLNAAWKSQDKIIGREEE